MLLTVINPRKLTRLISFFRPNFGLYTVVLCVLPFVIRPSPQSQVPFWCAATNNVPAVTVRGMGQASFEERGQYALWWCVLQQPFIEIVPELALRWLHHGKSENCFAHHSVMPSLTVN